MYSLVNIRRSQLTNKWYCTFEDLPHDREDQGEFPNSIGFFYYNTEKGKEYAFTKLKQKMIDDRLQLIKQLQDDIKDLDNFKMKKRGLV